LGRKTFNSLRNIPASREQKNEDWLNKNQQTRLFHGKRQQAGYFQEYDKEQDEEKCKVAIRMLKQAANRGILASYVLTDSRFVTDYMLRSIRSIRGGLMYVTCMCKMDRRRFEVNGKLYNSHTIIKINEAKKGRLHTSRKFNSKYMAVVAKYV
jgi:hypothetical protein